MKNNNTIQFPYNHLIDTNLLSQIFNHTTNSYKFLWFKAILDRTKSKLVNETHSIKIVDIILDMIILSYYMVNYCNLHLGYIDNLYEVEKYIYHNYNISPNTPFTELKSVFLDFKISEDKEIINYINKLMKYVPVCFLSPYIKSCEKFDKQTISCINEANYKSYKYFNNPFPYHFSEWNDDINYMSIILSEYYVDYFIKNYEFLDAFYKFNFVYYLQKRNPNVPGIINKLSPIINRNSLSDIKKFYIEILNTKSDIKDIYADIPIKTLISSDNMSIDHFIPWSFVANDELWNLTPTSQHINNSKSNKLPDKIYINKLINQKWDILNITRQNSQLKKYFHSILKEKYIFTNNIIELYSLNNTDEISENKFKDYYTETINLTYAQCFTSGFKDIWRAN